MLDIKQLPLLAAITLGTLVAAAGSWQGYAMYQQWRSPPPLQQESNATPQRRSPALEVALAELTLFGTPRPEDETAELVETDNLPETNLRLILRGVMAGEMNTRNNALVEGPDRETALYHVGEVLPGNATLRNVHRRRIVIERNGALETLHFPDQEELSMSSSRDRAPTVQQSRRSTPQQGSGRNDSNRQQEVRARLDELRERLRN
ncbi:MAG: general secretion pathway protein GspC [Halomonadaceae bacterium]|nr:MAG: general secretion pathway protein GspC [Halomonadaceae bacterium]